LRIKCRVSKIRLGDVEPENAIVENAAVENATAEDVAEVWRGAFGVARLVRRGLPARGFVFNN
jgi:hypothetical protein